MKINLRYAILGFLILSGCAKKPPVFVKMKARTSEIVIPSFPADPKVMGYVKVKDLSGVLNSLGSDFSGRLSAQVGFDLADFQGKTNSNSLFYFGNLFGASSKSIAPAPINPTAVTPTPQGPQISPAQQPSSSVAAPAAGTTASIGFVFPVSPTSTTAQNLTKLSAVTMGYKGDSFFTANGTMIGLSQPLKEAILNAQRASMGDKEIQAYLNMKVVAEALKPLFSLMTQQAMSALPVGGSESTSVAGTVTEVVSQLRQELEMLNALVFEEQKTAEGRKFEIKVDRKSPFAIQPFEMENLAQFLPPGILRVQVQTQPQADILKYVTGQLKQNLKFLKMPETEKTVASLLEEFSAIANKSRSVSALSLGKPDLANKKIAVSAILQTDQAADLIDFLRSVPGRVEAGTLELRKHVALSFEVEKKHRRLFGWPVDKYTIKMGTPESGGASGSFAQIIANSLLADLQVVRIGNYILFSNDKVTLDELTQSFMENRPRAPMIAMTQFESGAMAYMDIDAGLVLDVLKQAFGLSTTAPLPRPLTAEGTIPFAGYIKESKVEIDAFLPNPLLKLIKEKFQERTKPLTAPPPVIPSSPLPEL